MGNVEQSSRGNLKKLFGQKKIVIIAVILIVVLFTGVNIFAEKPSDGLEVSDNIVAVETDTAKLANSLGGLISQQRGIGTGDANQL